MTRHIDDTTVDQVIASALMLFPASQVAQDNDGQLVVYTGLYPRMGDVAPDGEHSYTDVPKNMRTCPYCHKDRTSAHTFVNGEEVACSEFAFFPKGLRLSDLSSDDQNAFVRRNPDYQGEDIIPTPKVNGCICDTCAENGVECRRVAPDGKDECMWCSKGQHYAR